MRVLLVSHTCQSMTEGQPKAQFLGLTAGVELCVLVPQRWKHYGQWRLPEIPPQASYRYETGKVAWPWSGPGQFYLHWYPGLAALLREFRPDVIDIWEEPWSLASAQLCYLRNRLLPDSKIITETEQNILKRLPWPFAQFRSYTLQQADFAVGRSEEALSNLKTLGYAGPAKVVPNAVDAASFTPWSQKERQKVRTFLGLTGFTVGYVGRLIEDKGLMEIVDALPLVQEDVHAVFVGSGPHQNDLEARAAALGLGKRVRFLGAKELSELPAIMNALNVLILPSRTTASWKEQFGRVLIEASACGIPVIGSSSGAIPAVVGRAGLVFEERDPRALADAIETLRSRPDLAAELGKAGRQRVEQEFTWQKISAAMAEIYRVATSDLPAGPAVDEQI